AAVGDEDAEARYCRFALRRPLRVSAHPMACGERVALAGKGIAGYVVIAGRGHDLGFALDDARTLAGGTGGEQHGCDDALVHGSPLVPLRRGREWRARGPGMTRCWAAAQKEKAGRARLFHSVRCCRYFSRPLA